MNTITKSKKINYTQLRGIIREDKVRSDYLPFGRPNFGEDEISAVVETMRTGWVGMGNQTLKFEEELSRYVKAPFVSTVNSCTSALLLALKVLGIKENDKVICPSLTWCSTANAVLYNNAKLVFCDIDPYLKCIVRNHT